MVQNTLWERFRKSSWSWFPNYCRAPYIGPVFFLVLPPAGPELALSFWAFNQRTTISAVLFPFTSHSLTSQILPESETSKVIKNLRNCWEFPTWSQQAFSLKRQIVNIPGFVCRPLTVYVLTTQIHLFCVNAAVSEWAWLCTHQTMFIDTDSWISYKFYLSKNIFFWSLLKKLSFFNYLKYKKIFSALKLYKKQIAGRIWPVSHSFLMAWNLDGIFYSNSCAFLVVALFLSFFAVWHWVSHLASLSHSRFFFFFALNLFFSFMR